jgi:hypothetical protein
MIETSRASQDQLDLAVKKYRREVMGFAMDHPNDWILYSNGRKIGHYPTQNDATLAGYENCPGRTFFVDIMDKTLAQRLAEGRLVPFLIRLPGSNS